MSFSEDAPARFRKVALNGVPLGDGRPQTEAESDEEDEETYIDGLKFNLRHDTSDIYIPLVGGELSLAVKRNVQSDIWTNQNGFHSNLEPERAFGPCWSSNLGAHLKISLHFGGEEQEPTYIFVTDENGSTYRFFMIYHRPEGGTGFVPYFLPVPSNRTAQGTFQMELRVVNGAILFSEMIFEFRRKFGTTLRYEPSTITRTHPVSVGDPDAGFMYHIYHRLVEVEDRFGNRLVYEGLPEDLIPDRITGLTKANAPVSNLNARSIVISKQNGRVVSVTDPLGHVVTYNYNPTGITQGGVDFATLDTVERAEGNQVSYDYEAVSQVDDSPKCSGEEPTYTFYHQNLSSITDAADGETAFQYEHDVSLKAWKLCPDGSSYWYLQRGLPRVIKKSTLANGDFATFDSTLTVPLRTFTGFVDGSRTNRITDAEGNVWTFEFRDADLIDSKEFEHLMGLEENKPTTTFLLIRWKTFRITLPDGVSETYEFNAESGLSLSRSTDYSGNSTLYEYGDIWDPTVILPWITDTHPLYNHPIFFHRYADPTRQTNALGDSKVFTYAGTDPRRADSRVMNSVTDELGRRTDYDVQALTGLRTRERVRNTLNQIVKETTFTYGNTDFPGFMTRQVVKEGTTGPVAAELVDQVTVFEPDLYGYGAITRIKDYDGLSDLSVSSAEFDKNGNKTAAIDANGHRTEFVYDALNRLIQVTNPDLSTRLIAYDTRGNKIKETNENGHHTHFIYDLLNRLTETRVEMAPGQFLVTTVAYNKVGSKVTQTDPRGQVTSFVYDNLQRLVATTDPLGNTITNEYTGINPGSTVFNTSGFKPTATVDARGYRTESVYDKLYRPTEQKAQYYIDPDPLLDLWSSTLKEYDAVGNVISETDPLGRVTLREYDAQNRPVKVTNPDSTEVLTAYTPAGLVTQVTDEMGRITTNGYDAAGRQTDVWLPDPVTGTKTVNSPHTQTIYDPQGNRVAAIDALHHRVDAEYDNRNRKTKTESPAVPNPDVPDSPLERPTALTTYDAVGNVISVTDARGQVTTTEYDPANRPVQVTAPPVPVYGQPNPLPSIILTEYDNNGNPTKVTDPEGNFVTNVYDALNRLINTTTRPEPGNPAADITESFTYDPDGNRTQVTDGKGLVTRFVYDGLDRPIQTVFDADTPLQAIQEDRYDALNKTETINPNGERQQFSYDNRHRLTGITYPGRPADNQTRTYDAVSNLLTVTFPGEPNGPREVQNTYDALRRLTTERSNGVIHQYTYDKAGNQTGVVYGGTSRRLDREFNALNRLSTLTESLPGSGASAAVTRYGHDLNGNPVWQIKPNGHVETRSYDAQNRASQSVTTRGSELTGESNPQLVRSETYKYDRAGNMREVTENWAAVTLPNRKVTNTYDGVYRLIEEKDEVIGKSTRTTSYQYDKANNRTQKTFVKGSQPAEVTVYQIGTGNNGAGANQLASFTRPDATTVTFAYDLNGSRVSRTENGVTDTYSFDYHARLVSLDRQGGEPEATGLYQYQYDHRTRRVRRSEKGTVTQVVFSGGLSVQEHQGSPANPEVEYVRGPDLGGGVRGLLYSLRKDASNNTNLGTRVRRYNLMNHRGDVAGKADESGAITYAAHYEAFGTRSEESGSDPDRQKANTKDEDPTGLLNEGHRYRDLETGVFITRDPAGFVDGPNLYAYVRQNPWSKFDPEGLWSWSGVAKGVAIGVGVAILAAVAVAAIAATGGAAAAFIAGGIAAHVGATTAVAATVAATAASVTSGAILAGAAAVGGYQTGQAIFEASTGESASTGEDLSGEAHDEAIAEAIVGVASLGVGSARAIKTRMSAKVRLETDQTMINNLVENRGPKGGHGKATFAQGESNGNLQPLTKNTKGGHGEINTMKQAKTRLDTIAVDQEPCPGCVARAVGPFSKLKYGGRMIVPSQKGKPTNTAKTATKNAAQGKAEVVPKTVVQKPPIHPSGITDIHRNDE